MPKSSYPKPNSSGGRARKLTAWTSARRAKGFLNASAAQWKNVRPVDGEADLIAGVRAIPAAGHSPGQVAHLVSYGTQHLLVTADVSLLLARMAGSP